MSNKSLFEKLFENQDLGVYELPFRFWNGDVNEGVKKVNVVFKRNEGEDNFRSPVIICEKDGKYQDFYYNPSDEVFKMLSEPGDPNDDDTMTFREWWLVEEIVSYPGKCTVPLGLKHCFAAGPENVFIQ